VRRQQGVGSSPGGNKKNSKKKFKKFFSMKNSIGEAKITEGARVRSRASAKKSFENFL
jgi:hypothetical protein